MHTRWLWARYAFHLLWEARQLLHVVSNPTWFLQETEWCELGCGHTTSVLSLLILEVRVDIISDPFPHLDHLGSEASPVALQCSFG